MSYPAGKLSSGCFLCDPRLKSGTQYCSLWRREILTDFLCVTWTDLTFQDWTEVC